MLLVDKINSGLENEARLEEENKRLAAEEKKYRLIPIYLYNFLHSQTI